MDSTLSTINICQTKSQSAGARWWGCWELCKKHSWVLGLLTSYLSTLEGCGRGNTGSSSILEWAQAHLLLCTLSQASVGVDITLLLVFSYPCRFPELVYNYPQTKITSVGPLCFTVWCLWWCGSAHAFMNRFVFMLWVTPPASPSCTIWSTHRPHLHKCPQC